MKSTKDTYEYKKFIVKISTSDSNVYGMKNGQIYFRADSEKDVEKMIDSYLE